MWSHILSQFKIKNNNQVNRGIPTQCKKLPNYRIPGSPRERAGSRHDMASKRHVRLDRTPETASPTRIRTPRYRNACSWSRSLRRSCRFRWRSSGSRGMTLTKRLTCSPAKSRRRTSPPGGRSSEIVVLLCRHKRCRTQSPKHQIALKWET